MRRLLALAALLWLTMAAVPSAQAAPEVRRRAVVVGANEGGSLLDPLQFAESDARRFAAVLQDLGGFAREDISLLVAPSVAELSLALERAAVPLADDDEQLFVFYYSGHADSVGLQLGDERYSYDVLKDAIREVPADVHLGVLDACRSGSITKVKGASVAEPFLLEEGLAAEGEAWISSSAADEDAQESPLIQGSFFTYYLLSALRGAADTGDGWVSLNEAYTYAYDRTVARTAGTQSGTQHPAYDFQIQGNGDLELTEVRRATAAVVLPEAGGGEIAVLRLPERTPIAEVAKQDGRAVRLGLEPGRYLLRRRADDSTQEVTVSLSEGAELVIDRWGDAWSEPAASKGGIADAGSTPAVGAIPKETNTEKSTEERAEVEGEALTIDLPKVFDKDRIEIHFPKMPDLPLDESPFIAGSASAIVPGLGQAYNGRWGRGAAFLGTVAALHSFAWSIESNNPRGPVTGPNPFTLAALALHGWSIAEATYDVHRRETERPQTGLTLSLETAWESSVFDPYASGLAIDIFPVKTISIGLDRSGVIVRDDRTEVTVGSRITIGPNIGKFRPALFGSLGTRWVLPRDNNADFGPDLTASRGLVMGLGLSGRLYLTPRYFMQSQGRAEWFDDELHTTLGGGVGVHLGR